MSITNSSVSACNFCIGRIKSNTWRAIGELHLADASQSFHHFHTQITQSLLTCRQICFNYWYTSGHGDLMDDRRRATPNAPRASARFTSKNQILKAMYMQITISFGGESKNHLLNFSHHQKKASMHPSTVAKGVLRTCNAVFIMRSIVGTSFW